MLGDLRLHLMQRARPLEVNPNRCAAVRARAELARLHRLRLVMRHIEQKVFSVGITAPALDTHRHGYLDSLLRHPSDLAASAVLM